MDEKDRLKKIEMKNDEEYVEPYTRGAKILDFITFLFILGSIVLLTYSAIIYFQNEKHNHTTDEKKST